MDNIELFNTENNQLLLISGKSTTGKTWSLEGIPNQERWIYINSEAGKRPPFRNKFNMVNVVNAYDVLDVFEMALREDPSDKLETEDEILMKNKDICYDDVDGIIIDSITFLMDIFESQNIYQKTSNGFGAWADYQQYFKHILQNLVVRFNKPVIILAHTSTIYNEDTMMEETYVPIKGALKNNGVESYFSTVVSTKKIPIKEAEKYIDNGLLTISELERDMGYKHVFQTRPNKDTIGERMRSPKDLFTPDQIFINNDANLVLEKLVEYYNDDDF